MNAPESVALIRLVAELWPSMRINSHTPDAWYPLLEDIDAAAAISAVYRLAKVSSAYIAPADIRREVAAAAGLLPPSEDEAWGRILAVAAADGAGRALLPPVLEAAYVALGRSQAIKDADPGQIRRDFGFAYRRLVDEYTRSVLVGDLRARPTAPALAIGGDDIEPEAIDAVLGRDLWSLPAPPDGIDPASRDYIEWARKVTAEHKAARRVEGAAMIQQRADRPEVTR